MANPSILHLVLTTEANERGAESLARKLLERQLVACISLTTMHSLYRWEGGLQEDREVQLLMKTTAEQLEPLRRAVMELHSYDTPEWLSWPVEASQDYGSWAAASCCSET